VACNAFKTDPTIGSEPSTNEFMEANQLNSFHIFGNGSVYFTADIQVATDWLELLCRQSNFRYCGMTQFE